MIMESDMHYIGKEFIWSDDKGTERLRMVRATADGAHFDILEGDAKGERQKAGSVYLPWADFYRDCKPVDNDPLYVPKQGTNCSNCSNCQPNTALTTALTIVAIVVLLLVLGAAQSCSGATVSLASLNEPSLHVNVQPVSIYQGYIANPIGGFQYVALESANPNFYVNSLNFNLYEVYFGSWLLTGIDASIVASLTHPAAELDITFGPLISLGALTMRDVTLDNRVTAAVTRKSIVYSVPEMKSLMLIIFGLISMRASYLTGIAGKP